MNGAERIAAERQRQITDEGWTADHDAGHANDLLLAAISYSYAALRPGHPMAEATWPWDEEWWKPSDRVRNLEKAGALIAAEIDRLTGAPAAADATPPPGDEPRSHTTDTPRHGLLR